MAGDLALMPTLAGIALKMEQAGFRVRVEQHLVPKFGPERRAGTETALRLAITSGSAPGSYRVVGSAPSRLLGTPSVTVSVEAPI
jgi:hypothetical protein